MRPVHTRRSLLVTGATGYLGRALTAACAGRGHDVTAFVRSGSERRVPDGVSQVIGDPFDARSVAGALAGKHTLVHLIGTPNPNPSKARQFREVDLRSAVVAAEAARLAGPKHIVYVSVAHPAPVMHAYIAARSEAEAAFRATDIATTVLRPWYVMGPGHRWPLVLLPLYWIFERLPFSRATATRLGLVTHAQMIAALVQAIEDGPNGFRVVEVPAIRSTVTPPALR